MKRKILLIFTITLIAVLSIFTKNIYAVNNIIPTASSNVSTSTIRKSSLVALDSGYMRVFYNKTNKNIGVEYYDNNFKILSKRKIEMELSTWGGFYAGENAYYIVEGQNNTEEDDSKEVIRIIKYDKNWNRIGAANVNGDSNVFGKEIRYPFDAGCVEMTEYNGYLYVVTGHEGYVDEAVGQGHQGFLMIRVDQSTLEWEIVDADLWHSFAQFIEYKDSSIYVLEQSEGSRCTKLTKYNENGKQMVSVITLLEYGGARDSEWAIPCYASVDGMAVSTNNILSVGTSIDQSLYDEKTSDTAYNIYLAITPTDNFSEEATTFKWLTDYVDNGQYFGRVEITKINDNKFMISWEENGESQEAIDNDTLSTKILHYMFIDENGNKLSKEYTAPATISDCKPIVKGSKAIFYASNSTMIDFYTIDVNSGEFNKVMHRSAGENIKWSLDENGVLTITGTGDISFETTSTYSSSYWYSIRNNIKEIIIKEGITSIPEQGFKNLSELTQVILPSSMRTIGAEAFAYSSDLRKIVILDNVTSIGQDALWSGWYTYGGTKIIYTTIYTTEGSYVSTWAEENNVKCKYIEQLELTDNSTGTTLKVLGVATTELKVDTLVESSADYTEMKAKVASGLTIGAAYNISTENGLSIGENELTFTIGKKAVGKTVTIIQKMSNGEIVTKTATVDNTGKATITTNELSSFMIAIDKEKIDYLLGDVNEDGYIDISDCSRVLLYVKGRATLTITQKLAADVNQDGYIDISDCSRILLYVKGRITKF